MIEQTVLFTPVPDGVFDDGRRVRVRVHVGPRLITPGKLGDYADWVDWPQTVANIGNWELRFPALGPAFTVPATPAVDVLPDSAVWSRLFPSGTLVEPRRIGKLTHRLLHSYSTETITDFLEQRWGRFGAQSPNGFPDFGALLDDDGFGPIAFERLQRDVKETGPQRRQRLTAEYHGRFDAGSDDPNHWGIEHPVLPADPAGRRDEIGRRFLELEHFHVRGRQGVQHDVLPEQPHEPTFHELVAMVQRYPTLLRALGLVIVLEAEITPGHVSPASGTIVEATSTWLPAVQHPAVYARTMCAIGPSEFRAIPNPNGDGDLVGGQLKLGDPRFRVDTVDVDTGAIRAMQFADNVARSRPDHANADIKYSAYTRDVFALPAQSSAGISVSRVDRANRLAHLLQRVEQTNASTFDGNSVPLPGQAPLFWADDLVRGYRWDVKAGSDGRWRSLMECEGRYEVGDEDDQVILEAADEGISVTGVTSAGGSKPGDDLYAHESLMQWGGWSLAVRPPGATVGRDDGVADPDVPTAADGSTPGALAPVKARMHAKPGSLPRLRFGETYRVRARTVDITGGGDPLDVPTEPGGETEEIAYLRHEPVSAPITALRDPVEIPGETNTVVVVRSEDAADKTASKNHRHVLPPRTNIAVAERHGMLDTDQAGKPLNLQALAELGQRDAQDLSIHPDIQPPSGQTAPNDERWFPVDGLALNYLPDPLAKRVLVRDLPDTGNGTEAVLDLATAAWPDWSTAMLTVATADATGWKFDADGRLVVHLAKGEDRFVRASSLFDGDDIDLMALWKWIADWHTSHGGSQAALADLHAKIKTGRHWMFNPWQTLRLVHAVRTPLLVPSLTEEFSARKDDVTPSATFATLRLTSDYSRKSTAQLELHADWTMKVDNGPKTSPDPSQPRPFDAVAQTWPLDHRSQGPDQGTFQGRHEFGDTKYRSVDYRLVATSAFTEFFREQTEVVVPAGTLIDVDSRGLVASTVVVKDATSGVELRQGPAADYTVDELSGSLKRGPLSSITTGATLTVSYVAPAIHTVSETRKREIKSSARPAAPEVEYVVPTFEWERSGNQSQRHGNSLRVYLRRPWWSSGDDERLGVVLWRKPAGVLDPPVALQPYVTMWGLDPVFAAPGVSTTPVLSSFPLATPDSMANVQLPGVAGARVDIAAHEVHFDADRDLWYADIELDFASQGKAYFPFVRLALCRYQPHSLTGLEISSVVLADFAQVAPDRTVSVSGSGSSRTVQVAGRAYSSNSSSNQTSRMQVTLERVRDDVAIDDPHLKWQQIGSPVTLARSISDGNFVTWTGTVNLSSAPGPKRLVIEELEVHMLGTASELFVGPNGRRVVFTDIIEL